MNPSPAPSATNPMNETLEASLVEWESTKRLAHLLYDKGSYEEAADLIWEVKEIPSIDIELAFAARILAKARPRKAIRLLTALLELNRGKAIQNLGLANALLHHGMVLQAARFYGAALEADPTLGNPDLEHFILWTDDEEKLWGDFKRRRPQLGELPWMRDPRMEMTLTNRITIHTTPIRLPNLKPVSGEELKNELYLQEARSGMQPSPPPAVTIPIDQVDPKYRRYDAEMGAAAGDGSPQPASPQPASPQPGSAKFAPPQPAPVKFVPPQRASQQPAQPQPTPQQSEDAGNKQPPTPTKQLLTPAKQLTPPVKDPANPVKEPAKPVFLFKNEK